MMKKKYLIVENLNFTEVYHKYKDNTKYLELMMKMMNVVDKEWIMK